MDEYIPVVQQHPSTFRRPFLVPDVDVFSLKLKGDVLNYIKSGPAEVDGMISISSKG